MNDLLNNVWAAAPEMALLVAICVVLLADAWVPVEKRISTAGLSLIAIAIPAAITLWQLGQPVQFAFGGMYVADVFAHLLKLSSYISMAVVIIYGNAYLRQRPIPQGEFHSLVLFSLLGQMVMMSAANMLLIYLGLEMMALSLYAMIALQREARLPGEAALKYFVLGALSSGFLLYGMSMIYGGTGSLDLSEIAAAWAAGQADPVVFTFGVVFIVAGLAFKLGAVPFHMWLPDVYQGAHTAATLVVATGSKLAAFAIAFRLLVEGMVGVAADWQMMLMILAVLSLAIGNIVGVAQTNFKRMLAYSTISQIGFVLLGLLAGVVDGSMDTATTAYGAALFYLVTYVLTTLGTFGLVLLLARNGFEAEELDDLRGLNRRSPWLALMLLLMMFSLAGVPPLVGFYAKLMVLKAVIDAGLVWLAVLAVVFSLIGAFYYIRVVKIMYFDEPRDLVFIEPQPAASATMAVNGLAVLALGILPGPLMAACLLAIRQVLGV